MTQFTDTQIQLNVQNPNNYTNNNEYIGYQHWSTVPTPSDRSSKYSSFGKFMNCMEIDWGGATTMSDFTNININNIMNNGITTSDELLGVVFWMWNKVNSGETPPAPTQYNVQVTLNGGTFTSNNSNTQTKPFTQGSTSAISFGQITPDSSHQTSGTSWPSNFSFSNNELKYINSSINGNVNVTINLAAKSQPTYEITLTGPSNGANSITKNFTVNSNKSGTLSISTNAGKLNGGSTNPITFNMNGTNSQTFTLVGNAGENATAPTISLEQVSIETGLGTFRVKSNKAGSLSLSTTAGSLSSTNLTMVANTWQTITITNNTQSSISPKITASQTINGTTGANISYTITASQDGCTDVQKSGTINGSTGNPATSTEELQINNIPVSSEPTTTYYWCAICIPKTDTNEQPISNNPNLDIVNNKHDYGQYGLMWDSNQLHPISNNELNKEIVTDINYDTNGYREVYWHVYLQDIPGKTWRAYATDMVTPETAQIPYEAKVMINDREFVHFRRGNGANDQANLCYKAI